MSHTPAHHPSNSTIGCTCWPLRSSKNLESYLEMIGSATSKALHQYTLIPSQGLEEGWWKPHFTGTTSTPITQSSFSHEGIIAFHTYAHSEQGRTYIPNESSHAKKLTPSTLERCSSPWSALPPRKSMTRPYRPRYNNFDVCMTGSEIWPKTWPISKSYIMTCDRRSKIPCMLLPMQMPFAGWNHISSTMPQQS
jgi:hypothetical protein